jgi:hypothetical protein
MNLLTQLRCCFFGLLLFLQVGCSKTPTKFTMHTLTNDELRECREMLKTLKTDTKSIDQNGYPVRNIPSLIGKSVETIQPLLKVAYKTGENTSSGNTFYLINADPSGITEAPDAGSLLIVVHGEKVERAEWLAQPEF